MAAKKESVSFDEIIQAGRQQREKQKLADDLLGQGRREKQRLADEILGQGRRAKAPNNGTRKPGTGPSLASRVGISKASQRSTSSTPKPKPDVEAAWGHDLHNPKGPRVTRPPRDSAVARQVKNDLLYDAAVTQSSRNGIAATASKGPGEEISIRGIAGPYVVIGSNFAPGTTAADIESAMIPSGGEMQSCRILTSTPTVIAEMVFGEKDNAESVILTFNNKKADGRILHVYMKVGGPTPGPKMTSVRKPPTEPRETRMDLTRNEPPPPPSYDTEREQSDRRRRADPEFQDGSYGFDAKEDEMDVDSEILGVDNSRTENSPRTEYPRNERRDDRDRDRRDDRRNARYDAPRAGGRGRSYFERDREGGRPRDDYRLHSDDLYPRPRGRGFR